MGESSNCSTTEPWTSNHTTDNIYESDDQGIQMKSAALHELPFFFIYEKPTEGRMFLGLLDIIRAKFSVLANLGGHKDENEEETSG